MAELLPCPFCDGQAELEYTEKGFAYIVCANCYARTGGYLNKEIAIKRWNTRTPKERGADNV